MPSVGPDTLDLPGYRDVVRVGSGGLGDVYRAVRESTGGLVAIKTVREVGDASKTERRVRREVNALLQLKGHPNVVQVEEVLATSGGPAVVMEYLPGGSLHDLLVSSGRFSPARATFVVGDVAEALNDAHRLGLVHRDIKPHNIMIGPFGNPKICDFGIAAVLRDSAYTDRTSALSYRYASPEEVDDLPEIGPPADIYSLGVTLRQLISGETNEQRARQVLGESTTVERLSAAQRSALDKLSGLVTWMTSADPTVRPTADKVARELQSISDSLGAERVASMIERVVDVHDDKTIVRPPKATKVDPQPASDLPDISSSPDEWWSPA